MCIHYKTGYSCDELFECCDCGGGSDCGCNYCYSCNVCIECIIDDMIDCTQEDYNLNDDHTKYLKSELTKISDELNAGDKILIENSFIFTNDKKIIKQVFLVDIDGNKTHICYL